MLSLSFLMYVGNKSLKNIVKSKGRGNASCGIWFWGIMGKISRDGRPFFGVDFLCFEVCDTSTYSLLT